MFPCFSARAAAAPDHPLLDPLAGNVAFGSAMYGFSFTLSSYAKLYADVQALPLPRHLSALCF